MIGLRWRAKIECCTKSKKFSCISTSLSRSIHNFQVTYLLLSMFMHTIILCSTSGDESASCFSDSENSSDEEDSSEANSIHCRSTQSPLFMTPQQALCLLYNAGNWPTLISYADKVSREVNLLECLQGERLRKLNEISESFLDRRFAI